jgi:hypothetical protein
VARRNKILLISTVFFAFICLNKKDAFAQFAGSVSIGGYKSTNVEGRDSSSPDVVLNPSIDLQYNWEISKPSSVRFEATVMPNIYQEVTDRSLIKSFFGISGSFYLSDIEKSAGQIAVKPVPPLQTPPKNKEIKTQIPEEKPKPVTDVPRDISEVVSKDLTNLSELMDSFEILSKGLKPEGIDKFSDLKDSVSETVLALSDILTSQIFTESIAEVVLEEVINQKKIFSGVPMAASEKAILNDKFEIIITELNKANPQSDMLPTPKPKANVQIPVPSSPNSSEETNTLVAQALASLQSEAQISSAKKNAPVLTLINSSSFFSEIGSSDVLVRADLLPLTEKALATLLFVPVILEKQNNRNVYKIYSYSTIDFKPRIDLYFGEKIALAATYDFTSTVFPDDTTHFNDGKEHLLRADGRIELFHNVALALEAGFSSRSYDHPLEFQIQITPKRTQTYSTASNYSHFLLGGALFVFPFEEFSIGTAIHLTTSSQLRPYISDLLGTRSLVAGNPTIDQYSYDLTREAIFSQLRFYWDINISADFSYETRQYANVQLPPRIAKIVQQSNVERIDKGTTIGFDISRDFYFDSRLISIFTSFTPAIDIQSTNFTSTIKQFSYSDVTTALSFEFGF